MEGETEAAAVCDMRVSVAWTFDWKSFKNFIIRFDHIRRFEASKSNNLINYS